MSQDLRANYFGYRVVCKVCGKTKKPLGRSAPMDLHFCDTDCEGYRMEPQPSHLWYGESEADFGYKVPR